MVAKRWNDCIILVPRSPKGIVRSITDSLTSATGYNVTGLYERAQSGEAFDRSSDASDGFVRLTDDNFDELVSRIVGQYLCCAIP